jgi:MFS family permease
MSGTPSTSPRNLIVSAFTAFAVFGSFWGVWGASVPRVRDQAGITDGRLGFALLFVAAGALPAMLLVGRVLDRRGLRTTALLVSALGTAGVGVALTARNLLSLCIGLALVGAFSGAADVAVNAVAGRAEALAGRPVITRAHGVFSTLVVFSSLATGLASAASLPLAVPFAAVAALSFAAAALMLRTLPSGPVGPEPGEPGADTAAAPDSVPSARPRIVPLLLVGALGALAFAGENAHQSWSAVFAHDELHAGPGLAAVAPAVFAATVAVTRFSIGGVKAAHARTVVLAGALTATTGTVVVATAPTLFTAALGLVAAGAGTAVLFPTLIGMVSRNVEESHRGLGTSVVTGVAYLGYLFGPVYVGLWAEAGGLRAAMVAVAALSAALFLLTRLLLGLSGFDDPAG